MNPSLNNIENPLFSIVIVNYNGKRFLKNCLTSVLKTNYPKFELIIVDNDSKDESVKILKEFATDYRVTVIFSKQNLHYAGGNNLGIANSKGDYIVFLNFDTVVDSNWLIELKKTFQTDSNVFAVQCRMPPLSEDAKSSGATGGTIDYCVKLLPATFLWERNEEFAKERRIFFGSGAALAIRREVLKKVGCFDPDLPTDEVDLCWRINLNGGHILLSDKSIVYHFGCGAFGKKLNKKRIFFAEIAALSAIMQNYELKNILLILPHLFLFYAAAIGYDLFVRRSPDIILFRLKAFIHIILRLPKIFRKRFRVQKYIRNITDKELQKLIIPTNVYYYLPHNMPKEK